MGGIYVDALPHYKYVKIIYKSTANTIFKSSCAIYEGNQQVQGVKTNPMIQQYELFMIKNDENIESMFFRFQVLVFGLQVLNKSYMTMDHIKKILRSLPIKFIPKVTVIQESKDLNSLSLEGLISSLQSQNWS